MDNQPNNSFLKLFTYVFLALLLFTSNAKAEENIKIAVVDVQNVLDNSVAVTGLRKSIDTLSEKLHGEMSKKEVALKKQEAEIVNKKGILKPEDFDKEVNDFYKKVSETQHEMQQKKAKLEQAHADAISNVHENTLKIIAELAKEKGFNIALPISQILYTDNHLTITKEVIARLNERVKTIELKYK